MTKFGLYKLGDTEPHAVYEGDCMRMNADEVQIFTFGERGKASYNSAGTLIASIRLEKGQGVRLVPQASSKFKLATSL
jgi:hypothetical protein